jgi:mannosylfructose-phosphate synthase
MNNVEKKLYPRIAMVSTHGYVAAEPPLGHVDTGGQVAYVLELSKKIAEIGYAVDIWTRRFEDQPEIDIVNERVRIIRIPCGGRDFIGKEYLYEHLDEWAENATKYILEHQLDYCIFNSHYWDAGYATQNVANTLGIPHVHTPHSLGVWKKQLMATDCVETEAASDKKYNFTDRIRFENLIYRNCKSVIATTPMQVDMLIKDYGVAADHIHMIPAGYDDSRFFPVSGASRETIRQRLGFEGKVVLSLGRLAHNKGYDLLVDAFAVVAARVPDAQLYLAIGTTQLEADEQNLLDGLKNQISRLGLESRVKIGGFVADNEMADYYRAADVFVLSSRYEPFGMTAIEAMACGAPTVITSNGGLMRAITFGRHALYADTFDREDLGISIVKPLKDPQLAQRLSRMGAHRVRSLFTWSSIAQQMTGLVEDQEEKKVASFVETEWDEPWNDGD